MKGGATVRVGTDCSGLDVIVAILKHIVKRIGVNVDHVFSCEKEPHLTRFISRAHAPKRIYTDPGEPG